jgi:lysozyme
MKINQAGIELIKQFEGLRLKKYKCPAGYYTIGYGHVLHPNQSLETINKKIAEELLLTDLQRITEYITPLIKAKLNANQFSALVSFAYNIGLGNFSTSTLLKKANKELHLEVPSEFIKWININKIKSKGLLRRRCYEAALYMEY